MELAFHKDMKEWQDLIAYIKGIIEDTWADKRENERKDRGCRVSPRINDWVPFALLITLTPILTWIWGDLYVDF